MVVKISHGVEPFTELFDMIQVHDPRENLNTSPSPAVYEETATYPTKKGRYSCKSTDLPVF